MNWEEDPSQSKLGVLAWASKVLFWCGVPLIVLGPIMGYMVQDGAYQKPILDAFGALLWWVWALTFVAGAAVGFWGWRRSGWKDSESRRYAIQNLVALLTPLALIVLLGGVFAAISN